MRKSRATMKLKLHTNYRKLSGKMNELETQINNRNCIIKMLLDDVKIIGDTLEIETALNQLVRLNREKSKLEIKLIKLTFERNQIKAVLEKGKSKIINLIPIEHKLFKINERLKEYPLHENSVVKYDFVDEDKNRIHFFEVDFVHES